VCVCVHCYCVEIFPVSVHTSPFLSAQFFMNKHSLCNWQNSMQLYLVISNAFLISGQWKNCHNFWHIQRYLIGQPCRIISLTPTATSCRKECQRSKGSRLSFCATGFGGLLLINLVSQNNTTFVLKIQVLCSATLYHWVNSSRRFDESQCLAIQDRAGQRTVFVPKLSPYFASPPQPCVLPFWRLMRC
jgi:hypothetical protein